MKLVLLLRLKLTDRTMKQSFIFLAVLLCLCVKLEAEPTTSIHKVDVLEVHTGIQNGYTDRSETISADITGHVLTITFNDNVGIAHIVIKDSNGVYIDRDNVFSTPDHATFIINDAGYYRMDITLSNGEQYYGYFRVEN